MAKRRPNAVRLPHGSPFAVWWRRRSPRRRRRRSSTVDRYTGVRKLRSVPELRGPIDAQLFFERFVATRTPVIVRGGVQRETMAVLADDAALEAAAGDCQLQVEVRAGAADAFGKGNRRRMRFGALLRKVAQGATQYYLTTQELPQLRGGGEQLVGPPLSRLPGRFPLRPPLLPSLIPQSINLWLGRADGAGASSGLHHDFHDNLYCLLRGRKTFKLYPPSDGKHLYTHGALRRIHPNGRINYKGEATAADGRTADDIRRLTTRRARREQIAAERALEHAEARASA